MGGQNFAAPNGNQQGFGAAENRMTMAESAKMITAANNTANRPGDTYIINPIGFDEALIRNRNTVQTINVEDMNSSIATKRAVRGA
jgi:hypothetical protein